MVSKLRFVKLPVLLVELVEPAQVQLAALLLRVAVAVPQLVKQGELIMKFPCMPATLSKPTATIPPFAKGSKVLA
jgi:hypothetical protein